MTVVRSGGLFTLGEALAVFLPQNNASMASATLYRRTVAGSETNVAVGVTRLGIPARLVTIVGNDALGDAVESTLREWGIDAVVGRSERATGVLVRELAGGEPARAVHLRTASAATELAPAHVDSAWSGEAAAVFVTGITAVRSASARAAVVRAVELARSTDALVIADPNFRSSLGSRAQFSSALSAIRGRVDVAVGDEHELALLSGTSARDAVAALLDQGCRLVITKFGSDGAAATDGSLEYRVDSLAAHVKDTVGAGDAFAAGLVVGLIEGASVPRTLELASAVAARVVESEGDIEGLPLRGELNEELRFE